MPKMVTRRTVLASVFFATMPVRPASKDIMPVSLDSLDRQSLIPIDNKFIAVNGWVIPVSNLANRAKKNAL